MSVSVIDLIYKQLEEELTKSADELIEKQVEEFRKVLHERKYNLIGKLLNEIHIYANNEQPGTTNIQIVFENNK